VPRVLCSLSVPLTASAMAVLVYKVWFDPTIMGRGGVTKSESEKSMEGECEVCAGGNIFFEGDLNDGGCVIPSHMSIVGYVDL